ncbi:MAG TPA: glycosyltransferase family 39 protein, partial [Terracidiphilus sp.]|nr:glycosyltransferase family 39 protein [Terracidiphilus sp.]
MEALRESQTTGGGQVAHRWGLWASTAAALAAGAALRAWMLGQFFEPNGDTLVYGSIAKNLLAHGWYAVTDANGVTRETLMRLPGYPLFLAACFRLFGVGNYVAVAWVQLALELAGCLLLADFARRIAPEGMKTAAGQATLWLAALCPFTAIYAVTVLTEGPTLFLLALALWTAARFVERPGWAAGLGFTAAVTYSALLRPDGALVAVALAPALLSGLRRGGMHARAQWRMVLVCVLLALGPFAAWTWRNWRVFHLVQPLVPESATDPGDPVYPGWERWVRTWCLDFNSTYQVYWRMPDDELKMKWLPERAFDAPGERADTAKLLEEYDAREFNMTPAMDAGFAGLARKRIA